MSALEREVIEKFRQLDKDAQKRVQELILQEVSLERPDSSAFDYEAWFRDMESLRQQIRTAQGDTRQSVDVVGLLRDIRDGWAI